MNEAAKKLIAKAKRTALEDQYLASCRALGLPEPQREYRWRKDKRWRFDFAWIFNDGGQNAGVEIEGGTWIAGRHIRGIGFEADCRKYNRAAMDGWIVLRFTGAMVKSLEAAQVTKEALGL